MTPWTVARQVPLSMGFSRQECWSGLPFLSPGDLPHWRIKPRSPALQADSLLTELHWICLNTSKIWGVISVYAGKFLYRDLSDSLKTTGYSISCMWQRPNFGWWNEGFLTFDMGFPGDAVIKNTSASAGDVDIRKSPWRRKRQPSPVFLPGKFHGWRSLVGYSP